MTKIDIFSGFLGAGKTTLIKKLIREAYGTEQLVLIENEFGEIGIDGGFLQEAGIVVNEMNSGCICCSLVGDFGKALHEVIHTYHPDRIIIEPSGVGKLSDVVAAVKRVTDEEVVLGAAVAVVDANKCKLYMKNFGEFYRNQVQHAGTIVLSRSDSVSEDKLNSAVALLRQENGQAVIITTPWDQLSGKQILEAMEQTHTLSHELEDLATHTEHPADCTCGCHDHEHHHDHEHCHDHEHEHHHDHEHEHHHDHEHEHHHDHDHDHCHDHEHHHDHGHHHAHDVFRSWGVETHKKFSRAELEQILTALEDQEKFGIVLRAKGIVAAADGHWLHFDHVPGERDIREGCAAVTGRLCVIGAELKEAAIAAAFGV